MSSLVQSIAVVLVGGALLGCASSRIPFTHEVRTQYRLSDDEVRNLQFYVSHTITLRRELSATDRQVTGGHKLVLTSGKVIEEVVIEESTPGVAVAVGREAIAVSFDVGSQLEFALRTGDVPPLSPLDAGGSQFAQPPDPFPGESRPSEPMGEPPTDFHNLLGKYWLRFASGSAGQVPFQSQLFEAIDDSFKAHLLIDADTLDEVVENRTVLPGRTL
jgi:hypothetical protein